VVIFQHYFLAGALPELTLGRKPEISFDALMEMLEENLSPKEMQSVQSFRRYFDLVNLRAVLLEGKFDARGNLTERELDEALLIRDGLPEYFFEFWESFQESRERIRNFSRLLSQFFQEEAHSTTGFLHRYFLFEREVRLVLMALRSKRFGGSLIEDLAFEDPLDPFVRAILVQQEAPVYQPPEEYRELAEIFTLRADDPWRLHYSTLEYRFSKVFDLLLGEDFQFSVFSLDAILGYLAQLVLAQQWFDLSMLDGRAVLQGVLGDRVS